MNAALSTRMGGQSLHPWNSLNLGEHVGDDPHHLQNNRTLVSRALNTADRQWFTCRQTHGTRNIPLSTGEFPPYDNCDAIILDEKHKLAGIFLADCLPILLYDPKRHIGSLAHAGWRGSLAGIAGQTVMAMRELGCRVKDIHAAVGPGIGPCCYQIHLDVASLFQEKFNEQDGIIKESGRTGYWRLNLEKVNIQILKNAGIAEENISGAGFCTACRNSDFFSHRREKGTTGRHAAVMLLR